MKKRELRAITGAELRVMEALWRRGEATIRDLRDDLYPEGGSSKFATVQKLLARLAAKKLVQRRKDEANWIRVTETLTRAKQIRDGRVFEYSVGSYPAHG